MKLRIRRLLLAASLALLAPMAAHASLQTLSNLFVFGDSLSDGGNYNGPGGPGAFPPPPYAGARYSNGPTAVEYLWQAYNPGNTSFGPSNFGGTNYALGGATTGAFNFNSINPNVPPALRPWFEFQGGVSSQVTQFAGGCNGCFNPADSLFVVWAFPDDVFSNAVFNLTPTQLITNGVANILGAIQALAVEGAQHFLIPNMADLGITPEFRNTNNAAGLTGLTGAFNSALAGALTALDQAMNNVEITQFNVFGTVNNWINNPTQYGLTNVTDSCVANLLNGQCDPATWLFWDGVHPTTAGHALLGVQFAAAVPEPASLWLIVTAMVLLAIRRRPQKLRRID
ncbi:MAG: PEP-CTERM sorting domain-containing protein [Polaromonas sp.]|nr:PEP-CTERM sorting domain-containing protein [Polaromonas sp.]